MGQNKIAVFLAVILLTGCASASGVDLAQGNKDAKSRVQPSVKHGCEYCHLEKGPVLKKSTAALCTECHSDRQAPNEHAVGMVPSMKVDRLPLFEGKIECITCHDPHENRYGSLLRVPRAQLCLTCHNK
jgi:predicted CXXCH cytochrome family protein